MGNRNDDWMHRPLTMHSSILQPDRPHVRDDRTLTQQSHEYGSSQRDGNTTLPRPNVFNELRHRASGRISPPPLKRQRTDSNASRASLSRRGPLDLPAKSSSNPGLVRRSSHGLPTGQIKEGPSRHSRSFPTPRTTQHQERKTIPLKASHSNTVISHHSTESGVAVRRACRVCEKSSATKYNPIFSCPGCARPYHDSCRKPPLVEGVEPQLWRCSKCESDNRVRASMGSSVGEESRRFSTVPSTLDSKLNSSASQKVRDNQAQSSLNFATESSPKRVSSFVVPQRSSEPLLVPSDRQADATLSVVESGFPCTSTKHINLCHDQDSSSSDSSIYRPNGVRPSNLVNCIDDLNREQISYSPLYTSEHGFAEILDTPTQRSSNLRVSGLLSDPRLDIQADTDTNDDNLVAVDQPLTNTIAMLTVLCGTCRRQRVFAKNNGQTIRCRNCRKQLLIAETGEIEIPENPHAASQNRMYAAQSPKEVLSVTSTPVSTSNPAVPWFQSNLDVSKPKIKQKSTSGSLVFNMKKASHEPFAQQDGTENTSRVPNTLNQILSCKEKPSILEPSTQVSRTYGMDITKVPVPTETDLEQSKNDNGPSTPLVIVGGSKMDSSNLKLESITTRDDWERHAYDEYNPSQSIESGTAIISHTGYASPDTSGSSDLVVKLPSLAVAKRRHTIRELAIIALAAAEKPHLTAEDIIGWLAKTFTYLRKGHGPWESAVKTRLSTLPELRRDKIPGASHNMKTYSFINASTRARYRTVFAEYCNGITTPVSEVAGSSELYVQPLPALKDAGQPQSIRVTKTVPLEDNHQPVRTVDTSEAICVTQVTPVLLAEGLSTPSMPFERAIERTPQVDLSIIINDSKRETSYEAFLKAQTLSVDSMPEDQRAAKIAQIKARPSRKQFFGSDHRLGHVRRYGRQDIHDESDGAWKPPQLETRSDLSKRGGSTSMLDGPTLREVFDLPENAIPMNDGQTELAFRDGTRINGRLPRSRQIYKVGKMFGGEITIRTS